MAELARCVGASVGAFGLMYVCQWRHYLGRGKYARNKD